VNGLEAAAAVWVRSAVQAAAVGVVALGAARVLGPRWPRLRYGLLSVALLKLTVPPLVASPLGLFPAPAGAGVAGGGGGVPGWGMALAAAYLAGSLAVAAVLGSEATALARLRARAAAVTGGPVAAEAARLAGNLGLRRPPAILLSEDASRPFVTGLLRPALILPRGLPERLSAEALRDVLAHELAHLACHHLPGNAWRAALAVVWWPHPVYWLVSAAHRRAAEEWCDDAAMAVAGAPAPRYARSLVEAAGLSGERPEGRFSWGCDLARGRHPLEFRLARLAAPRGRPLRWLGRLRRPALAVIAVAVLTGARPGPAPPEPAREPSAGLVPLHPPAHDGTDPAERHRALHALRHGGH